MPFSEIQLIPGVNTVITPALNKAGVSGSNLIRWRGGLPEKLGGWQRFVSTTMASVTRALLAWQDLSGTRWLGVGSLSSLKAIANSAVSDITPETLTTDTTVNVSTTIGSKLVTIVDANINNVTNYDAVFFNTPISVGGIILSGLYPIQSGTTTSFIISALTVATSTVSNGGAVPSFSTTAGSSSISVNFANHGLSVGDSIYFPIPTLVGGITISGLYTVNSVTTTSVFVITSTAAAVTAATSVSMNGGLAQYVYALSTEPPISLAYGALGAIGQFAIGEGFNSTSILSTQSGDPITATDWSLDNWGETLLACPRGGMIYYWPPTSGFQTAIPIGSGPPFNNGIFVSTPQQILVAWGSSASLLPGSINQSLNPLLVRWSDALDFTSWIASTETTAGSFLLSAGSRIMGAIQGAEAAYIFTDIDVWRMSYIGFPLVFGFKSLSAGYGLVGPHAVTSMRGVIYWMADNNFCSTQGGGVTVIPCPIWDTVFQDLDTVNKSKAVAAANVDFDEITFFFPSVSGATGENDKYAKYNTALKAWDFGEMARSAWVGRSLLGTPIGADPDTTYLQQHETSYNADGAAMDSYFETGYFAYGDGQNFAVVDQFQPDMKFTTQNSSTTSAQINVTMTTIRYPNDPEPMTNTGLTMTSTTQYLTPRLRGRMLKWRIGSSDSGTWWRLGNVRYRYGLSGRQ